MITLHIVWIIVTLILYCLCNSVILMQLLCLWRVPSSGSLFKDILLRTVLSVMLILVFFYFIAKMFCWSAQFMQCVECICWSATSQVFDMQTISAHLLFFFGVTGAQLVLLPIVNHVSTLRFAAVVIASNVISTVMRLLLISVWPL